MVLVSTFFVPVLIILLAVTDCGYGNLYANVLIDQPAGSDPNALRLVSTVKIDPTTGKFDVLNENTLFSSTSSVGFGISAFDQKSQRFYFALDLHADIIFAVDATTGNLLAPLSTSLDAVREVDWDEHNNQVLVLGFVNMGFFGIYAYPDNRTLPVKKLLNLRPYGLELSDIYSTFIDHKGNYLIAYHNESSMTYGIMTVPINSPKSATVQQFVCGSVVPNNIFYDAKVGIFGVGLDMQMSKFCYYQVSKPCVVIHFDGIGALGVPTYDPTTSRLFMAGEEGGIYTYDLQKQVLSMVNLSLHVVGLEVSYSL